MDQETSDNELKHYFRHHKKEIENNGFSESVLRKLPEKKSPYYIIYLCLLAGILLFILPNGYDQVLITLNDFILSIGYLQLPSIQSIFIIGTLLLIVLSILLIDTDDSLISI